MKNKHKLLLIFISYLLLNFVCCTSSNNNRFEENIDYTEMEVDTETIIETFNNTPTNEITINLPTNYSSRFNGRNSVTKETIINLIKKYKYHVDKNDADDPIKANLKSINNVEVIDIDISSLKLKSNTLYLLGEAQYSLNSIIADNVENTILMGMGLDKTIIIGAMGLIDSKDIVISNLAIYYEKNKDLAFSSIALINTDNVLLDYVWTLNSSNGIELSESSSLLTNTLSTNNKNTNIYAYNGSTLDISKSLVAESNYNGVYMEESTLTIFNSELHKNGYSGIYLRDSVSEIIECKFTQNLKYGLQLKNSTADIYESIFQSIENTFDYEGDIYYNYLSKFTLNDSDKESIIIKKPEILSIKTQEDLDKALSYAEVNDNLIINIYEGNYQVDSIITEREDIFIRGDKNDDVDFIGYLAFASCYDVTMENIDFKFNGEKAFNVVEFKNCYFVDIDNFRVNNSKQNGMLVSNSILSLNNFYAIKSKASGIAFINSEVDITDSFFENNETSGISSIRSIINMNNVVCKNNRTYNGLSVVESDIKINDSDFTNNGNSGISSENSLISINNSKISDNSKMGIDVISSNINLSSVNVENNVEYGFYILDKSNIKAEKIFISSNQIGGIYSEGKSDLLISDSIIRKSGEYGIIITDNNSQDISFNDMDMTYLKYGIYIENSTARLEKAYLDYITDTGFYITRNGNLSISDITYGENINNPFFVDNSSSINDHSN
jgi:hypothetical protein